MPKKNRKTLKEYFEKGNLPSQNQFGNLVDSMLNVVDEGFDKTATDGFKVSQLGKDGKLISFFKNIAVKSPLWSIKVDWQTGNLILGGPKNPNVLSLAAGEYQETGENKGEKKGRIGINKQDPEYELDVAGTIASCGRIGCKGEHVPANGEWQHITGRLEGCRAFEIMAGVGKTKSGKYALLHAFALKTFNARGKIIYHQAHYGSRCNRLKLRWKEEEGKGYRLELKTRCCYGDARAKEKKNNGKPKDGNDGGVYVNYYLTELWFDPFMDDCTIPE